MMLLEFILLNATGFFTALQFMANLKRRTRFAMFVGLCVIYAVLIAGFANQFQVLWPSLPFAWLALGKLAWIVRNRRCGMNEQVWLMGTWAVSVVAYLAAVGIGVTQTLPRLGITTAIVPLLQLPRGGAWVDTPHKAVASAAIYFAAVAMFKWLYVVVRKVQSDRPRRIGSADISSESFGPGA